MELVILAAEDDANDVLLLRHAFRKAALACRLVVTRNGEETVRYLERAATGQADFPRLILLDLVMPVMGGFEVLTWMRSEPRVASVPVVAFSSSLCPAHEEEALRLGARELLTKPWSTKELVGILHGVYDRYLLPTAMTQPGSSNQPHGPPRSASGVPTSA